ncbi:MAG: O-antigen ligase family protein [Candidatus Peregrinibacteria bacterium]|nr:O-antigen ligase family protein [Candidatus Peregrinibacteria bacterium]
MKKIFSLLPAILFFMLLIVSLLHRGGISFQTHILWMIVLLPIALSVFMIKKNNGQIVSRTPSMLLSLILLLLLTIAAGWVYSQMHDFGLISITTLLGGLTTLLIIIEMDIAESAIEKALNILCVVAALLCMFGLGLYFLTSIDRLSSTFVHLPYLTTSYPNAFALFLLSVTPHALLQLNRFCNRPWLIINALTLSSLLLTFSRGALIMGIGIIVFLFILRKIKFDKKAALVLIGVIALTAVFQLMRPDSLGQNSFEDKYTLSSGEKASSVSERMDFWKGALSIIKTHPLFGAGPDTFKYIFPQYQTSLLSNSDHPHNMFLKQASEFGIPSTLLLLGLIIYALYGLRKTYRTNNIHLALGLSMLAIMGHNLLDYNLNFTSNALIFYAILGASIGLTRTSGHQTPKRALWVILLILTSIMFVGGAYEAYERMLITQTRDLTASADISKKQEAENLFAKIHPIFYEDAILLRAENAIEMKNTKLAKELLKNTILRNSAYAQAYNLLSETYTGSASKVLAKANNARALELDPWNDLRYYFQKITLDPQGGTANKDAYQKLLESYLALLQNNAHETVRSGNPHYAIKIAEALSLTELKNKLTSTAELERKKIH